MFAETQTHTSSSVATSALRISIHATGSTSNHLEQYIAYTLKEFLTEYEKR